MNHKISIVGMGYVGCGNALMFAKKNLVSIVDIDHQKVKDFNLGKLPITDQYAQKYFSEKNLNISATTDLLDSIKDSTFVILALPTNFDESIMKYDTRNLEEVATKVLSKNTSVTIVIKSTVDIGYTDYLKKKLNTTRILFSPEFLREGHALEDNLSPSRIIIGGMDKISYKFKDLLLHSINSRSVPVLMMTSNEAESVKLFSNTYLAMRVAFFNELDTFCLDNQINPQQVIEGVSLDSRIGKFYNNPSFGFGGLCLPKDSMQLLQRFKDAPHSLIKAIQDSNIERASFIAKKIFSKNPKIVGVYKLAMKEGSDNSRDSSVFKIIKGLVAYGIKVIVYDQTIKQLNIEGVELIGNFNAFVKTSDLIISNRLDDRIKKYSSKLFSRDIYSTDV